MKRLEDFECEKVEIKNITGGDIPIQTWCSIPDGTHNIFDGDDT